MVLTTTVRSRCFFFCFEALSKELLVPYICYCIEKGEEASDEGYQELIDSFVDDPMYMFQYHVTFTHLLGFHLYNEATRKNHSFQMWWQGSNVLIFLFIQSQKIPKVTLKRFVSMSSNA